MLLSKIVDIDVTIAPGITQRARTTHPQCSFTQPFSSTGLFNRALFSRRAVLQVSFHDRAFFFALLPLPKAPAQLITSDSVWTLRMVRSRLFSFLKGHRVMPVAARGRSMAAGGARGAPERESKRDLFSHQKRPTSMAAGGARGAVSVKM